jgi:hypothetical protein
LPPPRVLLVGNRCRLLLHSHLHDVNERIADQQARQAPLQQDVAVPLR